jgi:hypothetical protein
MPILDSFPTEIRSGDTVKWLHVSPDFSPADGWLLTVYLLTATGKIAVVGVNQGNGTWLCTLAMGSNTLAVGQARWVATVRDNATATEQFTDATGVFTVLPNLAAATTHDSRSHVRKVLEALEAAALGAASNDQMEMTIGDKAVKYLSPLELDDLLTRYRRRWAQEQSKEDVEQGRGSNNTVRVRFG